MSTPKRDIMEERLEAEEYHARKERKMDPELKKLFDAQEAFFNNLDLEKHVVKIVEKNFKVIERSKEITPRNLIDIRWRLKALYLNRYEAKELIGLILERVRA